MPRPLCFSLGAIRELKARNVCEMALAKDAIGLLVGWWAVVGVVNACSVSGPVLCGVLCVVCWQQIKYS